MALQADRVHVCAVQQTWIRTAMRKVTCGATFGLHHRVLVYKRARCFRVALRAHRIHLRRGAKILAIERAVWIVTVAALHQSLFHLVVVGHIELRLRIGMTLEAKRRLRRRKQLFFNLAVMNAVAAYTAHIVLTVRSPLEIRVLALVTTEALGIYFLGRGLGRIENLGYVPAPVNVRLSRPMAAFAGNSAFPMRLGEFGMRIRSESFGYLLVTGGAGFLADEISRSRRSLPAFSIGALGGTNCCSGRKQSH